MATVSTDLLPQLAAVRVPERSVANDLRAIKIVWQRELMRFWSDRPRLIGTLIQPMLYLFVLGTGLGSMIPHSGGLDFRTFIFPGVVMMAVLFTCFFSAGSLVWDREFGFMREMLVAPIRRASIVVGKCLGGATVGTIQGLIVLSIAGLVGVPYAPALLSKLVVELVLISFALTSMGVLLSCRIRSAQAFMAVMQMVLMPLFFISGAMFPLQGLPRWLEVLTRLDPITYAVDLLRRTVLTQLGMIAVPGVTWGGWTVPITVELGLLGVFAIVALAGAVVAFDKSE
ncbi:MAG TPA: ABC transporter permease [Myxococcaceae bacterium]|nr:ABC transporter permease [Myxococcaceae bacterium]